MLALVMPVNFILILLLIYGAGSKGHDREGPWQGKVLAAGAIWGVLLVIISESLSLVNAIEQTSLAIVWSSITALLLVVGWRTDLVTSGWQRISRPFRLLDRPSWLPLIVMILLFSMLLVVALIAPPNNIDALQYHMPRAVHWAQNQSLRHYPVIYDSQNSRPYWAELVILNARVLWGDDRPANLVQWSTLLGAVLASSGIAALLGGDRKIQWLAAAATLSTPMAILQSTTPKNDVASAFWVVAAAYFVTLHSQRDLGRSESFGLAASLGLGLLTKGTAIPFLAPLVLWYFLHSLWKTGWGRTSRRTMLMVSVILIANGAFWIRNVRTYGGPFGSQLPVRIPGLASTLNETAYLIETAGSPGVGAGGAGRRIEAGVIQLPEAGRLRDVVSDVLEQGFKVIRMMALHFVSPFGFVNRVIFAFLRQWPALFPPGFVDALETAAWNNEMMAGNPVHLVLILIAGVSVGLRAAQGRGIGPLGGLAAASFIGYLLISFAQCGDWMFCLRYQLPFFFLGAPLIALLVGRFGGPVPTLGLFGLLLYAVPYIAINNVRPVIGHTPWPTRVASVFVASAADVLFAQSPDFQDEYQYVADAIQEANCREVGLALTKLDMEYTFWWLLEAPQSGVRLHHLRATDPTRDLQPASPNPCAVICTDCTDVARMTDLPLRNDFGHVALYMALQPSSEASFARGEAAPAPTSRRSNRGGESLQR